MTEPPHADLSRTAIITMVRRTEFPAAWSSLGTLDSQLNANALQFVLLNDSRDAELEARLKARPHTRLITPGRNLGVAIGRNKLIAAALDWGAEIILSLDDDLLVPCDYVSRVRSWIDERTAAGERIGIVAPVVLDFHALANDTMTEEAIAAAESGQLDGFGSTESLRTQLQAAWPSDIPVPAVYHAGIRDWRNHYLDSYRGRASRVRTVYLNSRGIKESKRNLTEMRLDKDTRQAVLRGSDNAIPIHTAPGGACAYRADLLRSIGGIDEAFSPFGYEDSDFGIRALSAGFKNYTLPSEVLLHDLDSRQKERPSAILLYTQGRARALIGRKHLPGNHRGRTLAEVAFLAPLQSTELSRSTTGRLPSVAGEIIGSSVAYLAGFIEGLFTHPAEPQFGNELRDYPEMPNHMERHTTIKVRSWSDSPDSGLPTEIPMEVSVAYTWDPEAARFTLHRLTADAPGMLRVSFSAQLEGVGQRDSLGNPDPLRSAIAGAVLEIEDWGLLRRFETTTAWFRKERSTGYLGALLPHPTTKAGRAFKWFLSLRHEPAYLKVVLDPRTPVTVAELYNQTPGINQNRRLGLTTMVNTSVRY